MPPNALTVAVSRSQVSPFCVTGARWLIVSPYEPKEELVSSPASSTADLLNTGLKSTPTYPLRECYTSLHTDVLLHGVSCSGAVWKSVFVAVRHKGIGDLTDKMMDDDGHVK
eukprot:1190137-Prorocentrum_minimum.AAC.7